MRILLLVLSLISFLPISYCQVDLNRGLRAYYPFSGNANDASGNGLHATPMNGVQLTTDKFGTPNNAYHFDGFDDHMIVFDNGKLSPKSISVVAWVYPESANAQSITGKIEKTTGFHSTYHIGINYDVQAGFFWGLAPGGSSCNQQIMYNPNNPFIISPSYFSINQWHCVVGTYQDSLQKLYIDGVLVQTKKYNNKFLDSCSNTNFLIGRWWDGDPIPFRGKIDEVRVYDRELNLQEVTALCVNCVPPDGTLTGSTVCSGSPGTLTFTSSTGLYPYSLSFTDGTNTFTKNNVLSGVPFSVPNNPSSTTTYTLLSIQDATGCAPASTSKPVTINVNPASIAADSIEASKLLVCSLNNTILTAKGGALGAGANWKWYQGNCNSTSVGSGPSITVSPTNTTTYFLKAEGACNSTNCVSITVQVAKKPQGGIVGSRVCEGQTPTIFFNAESGVGPFTLMMTDGTNTYTQTNVRNTIPFPAPPVSTQTTSFNLVSIVDSNGCTQSTGFRTGAIVRIDSMSASVASVQSSKNDICSGESAFLSIQGGSLGTNAEWIWYANSCGTNSVGTGSSLTVSPGTSTTYFVRAEGTCNTTNCVSIPINVSPKPNVEFDAIPDVCIYENNFQITQARETTNLTGTAIFTGTGVNASGLFSPLLAGAGRHTITYTYNTSNGCIDSKTSEIIVNPKPAANAGADQLTCPNIDIQLNATGGTSYQWNPPTGLSDPSIQNPIANLNATTTFYVSVTDKGCSATDSVTVFVSPVGKEAFKMANAFTPNDDRINDCFGLGKWGSVQVKEFSIFNRWGQKVFSTKDASDCWDGTVNGKKQDSGGYVYVVTANTSCGEVFFKGVVMLIR